MSATNKTRRIMPLTEREGMRKEINLMKSDEKGESPELSRDMKKFLTQNPNGRPGGNSTQISRMERVLANGQPDSLNEAETLAFEKREKELREKLVKKMVPKSWTSMRSMEKGSNNPDFSRAAHLLSKNEHSQEFLQDAHEWQNVRRQLIPDDPQAGNLEAIRPKTWRG